MEDAIKKNLPAVPDETLEAIAGGSMNEAERQWFLDCAAGVKKKGGDRQYAADLFWSMKEGANRSDITWTEICDLLEENWDNL